MPKLPAAVQSAAENAEGGGGTSPLEEGLYLLRIRGVDVTGKGAAGPYWTWEFDVVQGVDGRSRGRKRLWDRISLSEKAAWRVKQFYEAVGFTFDSDTDEMLGEHVGAYVVQEPIQSGPKAGQMGNTIQEYRALDEDGDLVIAS